MDYLISVLTQDWTRHNELRSRNSDYGGSYIWAFKPYRNNGDSQSVSSVIAIHMFAFFFCNILFDLFPPSSNHGIYDSRDE